MVIKIVSSKLKIDSKQLLYGSVRGFDESSKSIDSFFWYWTQKQVLQNITVTDKTFSTAPQLVGKYSVTKLNQSKIIDPCYPEDIVHQATEKL